jgi:hypothetical protein
VPSFRAANKQDLARPQILVPTESFDSQAPTVCQVAVELIKRAAERIISDHADYQYASLAEGITGPVNKLREVEDKSGFDLILIRRLGLHRVGEHIAHQGEQ